MQKANKLYVVGIGYRPLGRRAQELVQSADTILASQRLAEVFQRYDEYEKVKDRIKVINKVPDTIGFIREWFSQSAIRNPQSEIASLVLLASGDPFFFGIGRRMIEEFGGERVEIFPDLSSVQTAFARINVPWDDAFFISLHGGPDIAKRRKLPYEISDIPRLLDRHGKMGILTDRENNPGVVADILKSALRNPNAELIMYVCERLGYPDEKITRGTPGEIAGKSFSDPNVVVIIRQESGAPAKGAGSRVKFGLQVDDIQHERGLITKDEIRAVAIHKLRLPQDGVLWDIGSGSGAVSLEAARLCPGLRVIAVEKEQGRIETIKTNLRRYQVGNVEIIQGLAPDALRGLPAPDRVFIGGSGGNLGDIVKLVNETMSAGIVVINAASLDTVGAALAALDANGFSAEVAEISVSRSKVVAGKRLMSALNPVYIIRGEKG